MPGPDLLQLYSNIEKANTEETSCLGSVIPIKLFTFMEKK